MSVKYDFYKTPGSEDAASNSHYHARVVGAKTVTSEELAKDINWRCSLTESDVRAVLSALSDCLEERLCNGDRVHLEGLGFFQMTLSCPAVTSPKEIRAESIRFKSVSFRPEKKLKTKLKKARFERASIKKHSKQCSDSELLQLLADYFQQHDYFLRSDLEKLGSFTRMTALRRIKKLVQEGKIIKKGHPRSPTYWSANEQTEEIKKYKIEEPVE